MKLKAAFVAIALVVASTQPADARLKMELLDQMQPGVTTIDDAIAAFGAPQSVSTNAEGQILLQWIRVGLLGGKHMALLFDKDRKFIRVTHRFKT